MDSEDIKKTIDLCLFMHICECVHVGMCMCVTIHNIKSCITIIKFK